VETDDVGALLSMKEAPPELSSDNDLGSDGARSSRKIWSPHDDHESAKRLRSTSAMDAVLPKPPDLQQIHGTARLQSVTDVIASSTSADARNAEMVEVAG
jgi:hypothetical protein